MFRDSFEAAPTVSQGGALSRPLVELGASRAVGIPLGPINVIREDPKNPDLWFVGTDLGVYLSKDRGRESIVSLSA